MKNLKLKKQGLKKFGSAKRKTVDMSQEALVKTGQLPSGEEIPLVIRPAVDGVDLITWAADNRDYIETLLWKHSALLFRGFNIDVVEKFETFVKVTSSTPPLEYKDRSTPRTTKGKTGTYTSTIHPADQVINPHNEGTYWLKWALKLYFCCIVAAEEGGETPIVDVRKVYRRLTPEIQEQFAQKQMMLVRNYNDGFGLPWQEVYQTDDKAEVEEYCRQNGIEFEWKAGDRLRTRQIRPAIRKHPKTGETVWFNHAAFFHYTTLEPSVQQELVAAFGVENLPYNTYYGDGSPIEPEVVEQIRQAYELEKVAFPWQVGDVMLLDNMAIAHAREPYRGDREILASMTEPYSGEAAP